MITFNFSRRPSQGTPSGFDLGDIEISGDGSSVSSVGKLPDQGMMIFPSLSLLLDQVRQPVSSGRGTVEFCGVDSSFQVKFTVAKGVVTAVGEQGEIGRMSVPDFIGALLAAVSSFSEGELSRLSEVDPVRDDLACAIADFRRLSR
ncbi:hypothetical protein ABZW30_01750 [Kitasatospora sp. NPDC004669]|uniref:hypothetical protein n=1 Tax=Kitasatospora sp. NPDC004669 TaxID=3154555 RepID=UPI0033A82D77